MVSHIASLDNGVFRGTSGVVFGFGGARGRVSLGAAFKFVDFGLQSKDGLISGVLLAPDFGLAKSVVFGLSLDHEVFKIHVSIRVIGSRLKMADMMKEVLIGAGFVGGEEGSSNAITLHCASITIDDKNLTIDMVMEFLYIELKLFKTKGL